MGTGGPNSLQTMWSFRLTYNRLPLRGHLPHTQEPWESGSPLLVGLVPIHCEPSIRQQAVETLTSSATASSATIAQRTRLTPQRVRHRTAIGKTPAKSTSTRTRS